MPVLAHLTLALALASAAPSVAHTPPTPQTEGPTTTLASSPTPAPKPPCPGQIVLIGMDGRLDCDVTPPQLLAIVLDDTPTTQTDCDDMGGRVLYDPAIDRFYCIGIDY